MFVELYTLIGRCSQCCWWDSHFYFIKIDMQWLLGSMFRSHWILLINMLMCLSHLCFHRLHSSLLLSPPLSGSKIRGGCRRVSLCLCSQEFQCTDPKELSGVCGSEGNNCSIDFQKAWNPVGRAPLACAHKRTSSFSLVYLLKITSLDSPKFQTLAELRNE